MNQRSKVTITIGSDGTGTGVTALAVHGLVDGVYYDADSGAPSTSDLSIVEANDQYPQTILVKANSNTDQWYYPRKALHNAADGAALTGPCDLIKVSDNLRVSIAQATQGEVFNVVILLDVET